MIANAKDNKVGEQSYLISPVLKSKLLGKLNVGIGNDKAIQKHF